MKNCKAEVTFFIKMGSSRAISLDSQSVTLATYKVNNTTREYKQFGSIL